MPVTFDQVSEWLKNNAVMLQATFDRAAAVPGMSYLCLGTKIDPSKTCDAKENAIRFPLGKCSDIQRATATNSSLE